MRRIFLPIILVATIIATGVFIYQQPAVQSFFYKPCTRPITYSVGTFDSKFNVSSQDFLSAIEEASLIWEKSINKDLFQYSANGKLKINLIYDSRQEATDKLKSLGFKIETTQASYDNLKAQYNLKVSQYERDKAAYEAQVQYWNSRGGAPKSEYDKLKAQQQQLNQLVDQINALANALNILARQLNLNVATYNTVGSSRGSEFEEGLYVSDSTGQRIDIYEFTDRSQLVRLLAHELGHALGLEHVEDPEAIMHRLNQGENDAATAADVAELKQVCRLQ